MKDQLFNGKVLFSLLAVVMCLGFTAMSHGAAVVSVNPAEVESPAVGEQLEVNINITGGEGVGGYQVTVNFDSTALSYVSSDYNAGYLAAFPGISPVGLASDSSIQFITLGQAPDGDHTLATITFEVVEAKASSITLTDVTVSDAGGVELDVTTADSMVTVAAAEEPAEKNPLKNLLRNLPKNLPRNLLRNRQKNLPKNLLLRNPQKNPQKNLLRNPQKNLLRNLQKNLPKNLLRNPQKNLLRNRQKSLLKRRTGRRTRRRAC